MESLRKNRSLFIDQEAYSALKLLKSNLLYPVTELMGEKEMDSVLDTGMVDGKRFPFPFLLAPNGRRNHEILKSMPINEILNLIVDEEIIGTIEVKEIFKINPMERVLQIYGTSDVTHPSVRRTLGRMGKYSVTGILHLFAYIDANKERIEKAKSAINAHHVTALMMAANPLHRAHERLIRQTLDKTDLVVIFLLKPYTNNQLEFKLRLETLQYFVKNFLPVNRVVIVPLETSYIFAGYNEIIIDAIVSKNYGCNQLTIGQNHAGVGLYYDKNTDKSIIDQLVGIDIEILISSEFVYCNECTTLVSTKSCPHGQHHHISYHSDSILELLKLGLLPPAVLMRKEISSIILHRLFPERFKNLQKLYHDIMPVNGLLEEQSEKDFYCALMKLYQTTSLT